MTHPRRQAAAVVSALLTLTMIAGPVSADDFDEQRRAAQERSAQTDRQIEALEASIEGLDAQLGQAVLDVGVLDRQQRTGMSGREDAGRHPPLHRGAEPQQPARVRDLGS